MTMKRCSNGHFYDSDKHQQCPYCGIANMDASKTMPIIQQRESAPQAVKPTVSSTVSIPAEDRQKKQTGDEGKTIGIFQKTKGIDPVVGWVVCIDGPAKGKDYRIKTERNFIGRAAEMDIALTEDESVSRENHAIISFNPKNGTFRILPGESRGLVYLNDDEVFTPTELKKGDVIELGATKLKFVPFCDGGFSW